MDTAPEGRHMGVSAMHACAERNGDTARLTKCFTHSTARDWEPAALIGGCGDGMYIQDVGQKHKSFASYAYISMYVGCTAFMPMALFFGYSFIIIIICYSHAT